MVSYFLGKVKRVHEDLLPNVAVLHSFIVSWLKFKKRITFAATRWIATFRTNYGKKVRSDVVGAAVATFSFPD
jgi:hypothetical protein